MFIVNPISGVYRKKNIPEQIARFLDYKRYDYTIRFTEHEGHARDIAKKAVEDGYHVCVAVGGDGSINEVAQSLAGTDTVLGIIPYGSGNGFATHLRIPPRDAEGAIEVLNTGKQVKLDLIKSNLRYIISNAGFGLDASVARRFRHQKLRGFFSYVSAALKELVFFQPTSATVVIDGVKMERSFYLFTVFNANQYGYNFGIFSFTSMKDGLIDIILLNKFSYSRIFYIFFCIWLKKPEWIKEAEIFHAKKVEIYGSKKMVYQFDGDSLIYHDNITFEVEPLCLNVIVPANLYEY